jgi:hypothetical protein
MRGCGWCRRKMLNNPASKDTASMRGERGMIKRVIIIIIWTALAYFLSPFIIGLLLGLVLAIHAFVIGSLDPASTMVMILGVAGQIFSVSLVALVCLLGVFGKLPGSGKWKKRGEG